MADIEARANERLASAKELVNSGKPTEAVQALTETLIGFPGLPVAKEAGEMLTKLAQSNEQRQQQRARRAAELIVQARDFYKSKEIIPCLDRCEILLASYGDLPEGMEASQLIQEIRANQEWLQLAADTLSDRLAGVYLAMADNLSRRQRPQRGRGLPAPRHRLLPRHALRRVGPDSHRSAPGHPGPPRRCDRRAGVGVHRRPKREAAKRAVFSKDRQPQSHSSLGGFALRTVNVTVNRNTHPPDRAPARRRPPCERPRRSTGCGACAARCR